MGKRSCHDAVEMLRPIGPQWRQYEDQIRDQVRTGCSR
jgi:hypothetical protein